MSELQVFLMSLTPNQIKFINISNFLQPVKFQGRLISKQQSQTKSAQHITVLWKIKPSGTRYFSESDRKSQLSHTPRGGNACSCGPGSAAEAMISLAVIVDFQATGPQAPAQRAMNLTWVLPCDLCTRLDNRLTEAACFGQNVPYSVSRQHQTVFISSSCCWAEKGRGQCSSSRDYVKGKKNENREG